MDKDNKEFISKINLDIHEGKYSNKHIYYDFCEYLYCNLEEDIRETKEMRLKYLLSAFEETKDDIQEQISDFDIELIDKINKENIEFLIMYFSKIKSSLNRIIEVRNKTDCNIEFLYSYYQAKLDLYTVIPHRVNEFIKNLANKPVTIQLSNIITKGVVF